MEDYANNAHPLPARKRFGKKVRRMAGRFFKLRNIPIHPESSYFGDAAPDPRLDLVAGGGPHVINGESQRTTA